MNKQVLYIMVGLPYSGKTTLTKELVNRFGFEVVSMDKTIDEENLDPVTMTQEDWNIVYSHGYKKLKKLLLDGKTVILDLGNLKRSERDTARAIAEKINVPSKLIYINVPVEEIKDRRQKNEETQERGHLAEKTLQKALDMWEEPLSDEKFVTYNQQMDLEHWIKVNIEI